MLNSVIDSRFRVEKLLAKRTGRDVYEAHDLETDERVVLKLLKPSSADENEMLQRRLQEARLLRQLNHPNVARVIETGLSEGDVFFVAMEYVTGRNLRDTIEESGPLPPRKVADYLDQLASILDFAHASAIVHRDIKPKNIVIQIDDNGREIVKLMGFVFAKVLRSQPQVGGVETEPGMAVGTAEYMSPEQAKGRTPLKLSDIYSLGVTLFVLLTGRLPFQESTSLKTMMAHVSQPVPAFSQRNPAHGVPAEVEAVVRKALAKEPHARPQTVGALARMFREAVEASGAASAAEPIAANLLEQADAKISVQSVPAEPIAAVVSPIDAPPEKTISWFWGVLVGLLCAGIAAVIFAMR